MVLVRIVFLEKLYLKEEPKLREEHEQVESAIFEHVIQR
jgi:hypothetical protein